MPPVKAIILAAGKSSRLFPLTLNRPKSLLEFDAEMLLIRTIRQLHAAGFTSIQIVVGHLHEQIRDALKHLPYSIEFTYNDSYEADTNSLSLYLGLKATNQPALIIEADVALSNACWPVIQRACLSTSSIWFTHGKFLPHQKGGIIKSDSNDNIIDMKIVSEFDDQYKAYSKNLGVVYIGPHEMHHYKAILEKSIQHSIKNYYMDAWIQHLSELPCKEVNLFPNPAGSFNTAEELEYCRQYLANSF